MESLSQEDIQKLKEAFNLFDKDGDGTIDEDELLDLMITLDPSMTRDEFKQLIQQYDTDGDGQIDWEEFCVLMKPAILSTDMADNDGIMTEEDMKAAFNIADADGSGFIEKDEDKSGGIDFTEFKQLMVVLNEAESEDEESTEWEYEEASHSSYTYITDSQAEVEYEEVTDNEQEDKAAFLFAPRSPTTHK